MSSQEKKNFLMRYRDCEREIVRLEEEIARWQSRAERRLQSDAGRAWRDARSGSGGGLRNG